MGIVIRGGTVLTADLTTRADVYCDGGTIQALGPDVEVPTGTEVIDASGCYVMPGGIDPHTHMQLPFMGTRVVDDFFTGTVAGVTGGTTMIVDFVIPDKGGSLLDAVDTWQERASISATDFGFHVAITGWSEAVSEEMGVVTAERGINSYKFFMAYKNAIMVSDEELVAGFSRCREIGAIAAVHAEHGELVFHLQQEMLRRGITGPEGHPQSRPAEVEGEAAARAISLAGVLGVPLYIVHIGAEQAAQAVTRARLAGQRVFGETLAGFLAVDDSVYYNEDWDFAASHVMSPCFKPKGHPEALWRALQSGNLQTIGTDHCTFTVEQKRMGLEDFTKIPNGCGGIEDRMSIAWELGVNTGRITPNEFVAATSTSAARIFNMHPQKGAIRVGSDADLVVFDPEKSKTISAQSQYQENDFNVFEGTTVKGVAVHSLSRGRHIWADGDVRAERGAGRFVYREPYGPAYAGIDRRLALSTPRKVER
ncbi:MAG: dihydropyrimidinase [Gemmatimonadetes bacterium]|nr:dihydropyrimidinase [Gemmatimonadota bacterium]